MSSELTQNDIDHRLSFADYSSHPASAFHDEHIAKRLAPHWVSINREFFAGALIPPHILLSETKCRGAEGDYANISGWGSTSQIRIRPSPDRREASQPQGGRRCEYIMRDACMLYIE